MGKKPTVDKIAEMKAKVTLGHLAVGQKYCSLKVNQLPPSCGGQQLSTYELFLCQKTL